MNTSTRDEATVIGAGIVGICCALSLIEKGVRVRLIDRDEPGQGASYGNAGVISPWSCIPQSMPGIWKNVPKWLLDPEGPVAIRPGYALKALPWAWRFLRQGRPERVRAIAAAMEQLNRPNVDLYRHHLAGTGHENLLRESWYVHVYRKAADANLDDFAWRLRVEHGAPVEAVSAERLRELEPDLAKDYKAAIVIKDQARALAPGRIGQVLADKFRSRGGEILQASVKRLVPREGGGWGLSTDRGELEAARIVLSAGVWSARFLEPLGIRLPLEAERGYHLVFRDPGVSLNHSIMEVDAKFVASSMEMGLRAAGTAEFAGIDAAPDYRRARIFKRLTKRMLPGLNTEDTEEWMGARPSLPDSLPCIGPVPGHPDLLVAFGHSHYGLGMAPQTGRMVADLATGASPNIDITPYDLRRFQA